MDETKKESVSKESFEVDPEQYKSLFDAVDGVVYTLSPLGTITLLNSHFEKLTGWPAEEWLGRNFAGLFHPIDLVRISKLFLKIIKGEELPHVEARVKTKSGEYIRAQFKALPLYEDGKIRGAIGIGRELTGLALKERELKDIQDKYNQLAMTIPGLVFQYNMGKDGKNAFVYLNDKVKEIWGDEPEKWFNDPDAYLEKIHPEDREHLRRESERVFQMGEDLDFQFRVIRDDNDIRWVHNKSALIHLPDGDSVLSGVSFDITDRKNAEVELGKAKEQAEKATELKDKFVSLVAHDLRSPFASILGMLEMIQTHEKAGMSAKAVEMLGEVIKNGKHMNRMIEDLLSLSRFRTGDIEPKSRFFDGFGAAGIAAHNMSRVAADKNISIVSEVPEKTRLYADPDLMAEVIVNLVSNAIKFSHKGGTVTIFKPDGHNTGLAVKDTGVGIDPAHMESLFKQEVKTTTDGTDGERGTGLGLPISHDIMQAHGGTLIAESEPGKGSVFYALLPEKRPTILVVDDDPAFRELVKTHLDQIDADISEAEDGEESLAIIEESKPDLVIADIYMSKMDGFGLIKALKSRPETSAIPILVVTNDSEIATREKALRLGADDFTGKLLEPNDFIPRVRRFTM